MTDDFKTAHEKHARALAEASAWNRTAVFDALAKTEITCVEAEFDGEGDSGGITDIFAYRGDSQVALPNATISVRRASRGKASVTREDETLAAALEALCYDYLTLEHGGWENDGGAYGIFRFDVAARTLELEFNGRFTDVHTTVHAL